MVLIVLSLHLCSDYSLLAMAMTMVVVSGPSLMMACLPSVLNSALRALFLSTLALESLWCLCYMSLSREMVSKLAWSSYP